MRVKRILIAIMFLMPFMALAQRPEGGPHGGRRGGDGDRPDPKQIEADRVGLYTRILKLTTEEAKKFWPVFNDYQDELEKNREQMRKKREATVDNFDKMTDAEMEKALDEMMGFQQKELDIRKKYITEFKKVLPMKKVLLLQRAEMEFKRELLRKFRERHDKDE